MTDKKQVRNQLRKLGISLALADQTVEKGDDKAIEKELTALFLLLEGTIGELREYVFHSGNRRYSPAEADRGSRPLVRGW